MGCTILKIVIVQRLNLAKRRITSGRPAEPLENISLRDLIIFLDASTSNCQLQSSFHRQYAL